VPDVAKNLTDELLRRVRDINGLAHSRELARTVLSQSQQVLNTLLAIKLTSTTLTTYPLQQFYTIAGLLTGDDAITRVMAVRDGARDLVKLTNFRQLAHLDRRWVRKVGPRFEAWTHIGRDMLVIYPAKQLSSTVLVKGTKLTTALTGEATELELPNEFHDYIITLAEVILLAKQRDLGQATLQLKRLADALPSDTAALKLHVGDMMRRVSAGTVTQKPQT